MVAGFTFMNDGTLRPKRAYVRAWLLALDWTVAGKDGFRPAWAWGQTAYACGLVEPPGTLPLGSLLYLGTCPPAQFEAARECDLAHFAEAACGAGHMLRGRRLVRHVWSSGPERESRYALTTQGRAVLKAAPPSPTAVCGPLRRARRTAA